MNSKLSTIAATVASAMPLSSRWPHLNVVPLMPMTSFGQVASDHIARDKQVPDMLRDDDKRGRDDHARPIELQRREFWHLQHGSRVHPAEVDDAEPPGEQITRDEADQDRDDFHETAKQHGAENNEQQR